MDVSSNKICQLQSQILLIKSQKTINCEFLHFIFQSYAQPSLQYIQGQQIFTAHPQGVVVQPATAVTTIVAPGQPQPLQPVRNILVAKTLLGYLPYLQKDYFLFGLVRGFFYSFFVCLFFIKIFVVASFTQVPVYPEGALLDSFVN